MTEQQAMRMALEALEANDKLINGEGDCFGLEGAMDGYYSGCFDVEGVNKKTNEAITALRQALEQQPSVVSIDTLQERVENSKQNRHEQQQAEEPCGWQFYQNGKWHNGMDTNNHRANTEASGFPVRDVYAQQPAAWEPLTDEERDEITNTVMIDIWQVARAIEAALRSKNT